MTRTLSLIGALALIALTSCGGGGGGGSEGAGSAPPPVPTTFGSGGVLPVTEEEEEAILPAPGGPPALPDEVTPDSTVRRRDSDVSWFPGEPVAAGGPPGTLAPNVQNSGGQGVQPPVLGPNTNTGSHVGQQPVPEPESILLFTMVAAFVLCALWRRGVFNRPVKAHAGV